MRTPGNVEHGDMVTPTGLDDRPVLSTVWRRWLRWLRLATVATVRFTELPGSIVPGNVWLKTASPLALSLRLRAREPLVRHR